jgi:hypothetical protein
LPQALPVRKAGASRPFAFAARFEDEDASITTSLVMVQKKTTDSEESHRKKSIPIRGSFCFRFQ